MLMPMVSPYVASATLALSYETFVSDTANRATYTFSSVDVGAAASGKKVIVAVTTGAGVNANTAATAVTVGGVSASEIIGITGNYGYAGFWEVDYTSATGNVVVTATVGTLRCAVWVYSALGFTSVEGTDGVSDTGVTGWVGRTIPVAAGGALLSLMTISTSTGATGITWTGLNEINDLVLEARRISGAYITELSADASYEFSVTTDASVVAEFAAISIR